MSAVLLQCRKTGVFLRDISAREIAVTMVHEKAWPFDDEVHAQRVINTLSGAGYGFDWKSVSAHGLNTTV